MSAKPMSEHHSGITELDERIPFLLAQLGAYVSTDFQRRLAPIGADPRTYAVLLALASADGQSQRQLSQRLGIHRNAMVVVIDHLEQRGLAKRLPRPEDRRAVAVTLTAKARRLLPALHEQGRDLENEIAAPLSSKERDTLRHLLQRVAAGAGLIPGVHPQLA
ncbi:MarR family winged helix-turn-helix transcriptional regulator [Mycobacterium sp. 852002-10029_SCH5224772]|uniref:MarR family winged helix-turn-helix transcriptional regulator n=1 Tax=Mycobacterium sp. 852002-10029_SCH5224772 TaxID=1834083 RepID=UPI0007FBF3DF|nr:MarR family transcriptional regulator [Mycobacterium sp. 852002-10029_SCH5224772]OBF10391.1 MarR family transcriptional regulator [Mycobacterium sp. 852002-10029_SCH5224772]